jgi:Sep15/SelM redox domain
LDKLPALKQFLRNGEAEWYHNVTVEFVNGHHPVLFISRTKQRLPSQVYLYQEEQISLLPLAKSKTALHNLFRQHGFAFLQDEEDRLAATHRAWQRDQDYIRAGAQRRVLRQLYFDDEQFYVKRFQQQVMTATVSGRYWQTFQTTTCPYGTSRPMLDFAYDNYKRLHATLYRERTGDAPPSPLQTSMAFKLKHGLPLLVEDGSGSEHNQTATEPPKVLLPIKKKQQQKQPIVLHGASRRWQRKLYLDEERHFVFGFQEHVLQIKRTFDDHCYDPANDDDHPLDFVFDTYRRIHNVLYESLFVFGKNNQNQNQNQNQNHNTTENENDNHSRAPPSPTISSVQDQAVSSSGLS